MKLGQKDIAGAEKILNQAVAGESKSSPAELALAKLYLVSNQPAKAEGEFRKAIRLDSKNGAALMGIGAIQIAGKRMDEAEKTYRQQATLPIVEYKPLHAMFLFRQGKRDAAVAEFENLDKEDPKDRAARSRLFAAYVQMEKEHAAKNLVAAALKKNAKDTDVFFQRAGL